MTNWSDWTVVATRPGGVYLIQTGTDPEGHALGVILRPGVPIYPPMRIASMLAMENAYGGWTWLASVEVVDPTPPKPRWPTRHRHRARRGP